MGYVLAAEEIGKSFGMRSVLTAASLWAEEGRVTALLGRNGSGKTTLVKIAAGCLKADYGVVRFRTLVSRRPRLPALAAAGLFYMPQDRLLSGVFTVEEHLRAITWRFGGDRTLRVVERLSLGPLLPVRTAELSSGERVRVCLAMAMVREPVCLLADEPLVGLAPRDRDLAATVLLEMAQSGVAVVVTGHETVHLMRIADAVLWCVAGTTHHLGTAQEARRHHQFRREYLGWARPDTVPTSAPPPAR